MSIFYKPSSYKKVLKYLKKNDFTIRQDGGHVIATHNQTGVVIAIPRHTTISNGVTDQIGKTLVKLGYDKLEVKKAILK